MNDVIELLEYVINNDFEGMLRFFPDGVVRGSEKYNSVDDFEFSGLYDVDALYISTARDKMKKLCLEFCLKKLTTNE